MAETYLFQAAAGDGGQRLDRFLSGRAELDLSRSRVQELIKEGLVTVNGKKTKSRHPLKEGDSVEVAVPAPAPLEVKAQEMPLDIIYEDEHLLVINKGAGIVVHPGAGNRENTLVNALLAHCDNLSGIGGVLRPGIVHRLDKETSGLLVAAKSDLAHRALVKSLAAREISRHYLALLHGPPNRPAGTVDMPVGRHVSQRKKMSVHTRRGKAAVTHYRVRENFRSCCLAELKLDTGRTHQIRVHMAYLGHPVLGDKAYGRHTRLSLRCEGKGKVELAIERQMLHAERLRFVHPLSGEELSFAAPLPPDMERLLKLLRDDLCQGK